MTDDQVIDLSLGEYRSLVAKAFRGVGYHWGLTEEAAHAVARLAELGAAGADRVVRLLEQAVASRPSDLMPDHAWRTSGSFLCPICVGTSIADSGRATDLDTDPVAEPVLLAPFLEPFARRDDVSFRIEWSSGWVDVSAGSITVRGTEPTEAEPLTLRQCSPTTGGDDPVGTPSGEAMPITRVEIDGPTLAAIERLAHQVYAPATDESRRAGAGGDL